MDVCPDKGFYTVTSHCSHGSSRCLGIPGTGLESHFSTMARTWNCSFSFQIKDLLKSGLPYLELTSVEIIQVFKNSWCLETFFIWGLFYNVFKYFLVFDRQNFNLFYRKRVNLFSLTFERAFKNCFFNLKFMAPAPNKNLGELNISKKFFVRQPKLLLLSSYANSNLLIHDWWHVAGTDSQKEVILGVGSVSLFLSHMCQKYCLALFRHTFENNTIYLYCHSYQIWLMLWVFFLFLCLDLKVLVLPILV